MTLNQLYRQYLRHIRQLPVLYLRQFFRLKAADDARAVARTEYVDLFESKMRRFRKDIQKMEAANKGDVKAFAHVLDLAYGRKGKLKRELLEPMLSDPNAHPPPRIIPSVPKSRPPVYSPKLRALLTSALSRTTKPLRSDALDHPPILPARADPTSEEAKLLGPFSKRREVNIRWRYFTAECKKVLPPLHQQTFEDIERLVGPLQKNVNLTKRELQDQMGALQSSQTPSVYHRSRWLRRRYQQLLGRIPVLNTGQSSNSKNSKSGHSREENTVTLSPSALSPSLRFSVDRLPDATPTDAEWFNATKPNCVKRTIRPPDDGLLQSKART